jgi:hypothetical protein
MSLQAAMALEFRDPGAIRARFLGVISALARQRDGIRFRGDGGSWVCSIVVKEDTRENSGWKTRHMLRGEVGLRCAGGRLAESKWRCGISANSGIGRGGIPG